ncbi:MAG: hypothetical protein II103_11430, partial [Treponema sp.]|nr:hypothetical protein [Treponema sp.]
MESGINIKTLEGKKKYFVILALLVSSIFAFAQVSSGKYPDSKYRDSIQTFYYELYDFYLYGYPCSYESFDCLKKL